MSAYQVMALGGLLATTAALGTVSTTVPGPAPSCHETYLIKKGDTLLDISHDHLGTVFAVQKLIDANPDTIGPNLDLIFVGDTLTIPCEQALPRFVDFSLTPDAITLARLLRDTQVQVLDIRNNDDVANGVIPGTLHIPFSVFYPEGADEQPRPSEARMSEIVGLSGLRLDEPIIIVNGRRTVDELAESSAIFTLLDAVGVEHIAILRDGYGSWVDAALPVVVFPDLRDPYEVQINYKVDDNGDMHDVSRTYSSFWQEASPDPHKPTTGSVVLARWMGK